jgi:hypothetical protein
MKTKDSFLKQAFEWVLVFNGIAIICQYCGIDLKPYFIQIQTIICTVSFLITYFFGRF